MADAKSEAKTAEDQDEAKPGACRQCTEMGLDCFAFFGRTTVAAASGAATMTKKCVYPVKETLLSSSDAANNYLHPWQQKRPAGSDTPTFRT
mmetsp:Transcript_69966/g.123761  ORF Transcript_69966/g.123761 Transcript_69966/m.123761 type:complete len:92 (+) Transcript_69966:104-379(+)|eukprot:CAMPEP_0197620764 /NCGR_PEP_ID=MMETSP1338-20131121/1524_1 /TAXON_ID=43686 ORGANISM="Pelagodinium beii, Strain RCC1491" /NCGR_SAMPLE_ID=MMETSP1338 /ASSEMBLY_ACC=CAM_ASM_000754 /LENGTH=91 /DNA_ID=CAMNT_0043190039 /DNA_START=79 /DNA_END=354 /DNA_ORIENTATION=+